MRNIHLHLYCIDILIRMNLIIFGMVNISSCVSILLLWICIFVIYFKYLVRDNFRRKLFKKKQEHHEWQQHRNTMELSLFNLETSLKMNIILVKWRFMQSETSFLNISTAESGYIYVLLSSLASLVLYQLYWHVVVVLAFWCCCFIF